MPLRSQLLFVVLLQFVLHMAEVRCQDDIVKQRALTSLERIENYPSAVIKGRATYRGKPRGLTHLHVRGEKMWMEVDYLTTADDDEKRRLLATYEVMGTKNFPYTAAFDGKRLFEFKPYTLTLTIQTTSTLPAMFSESALLPTNWLHMGANHDQTFRRLIEMKKYETKIERIGSDRWKLSQKDLGNQSPGGNEKFAIRDRYIIIDEKCDYLVTEYWGRGFQGELAGTFEWAKQDGKWYAKSGKQTFGGQPYAEWSIDEISFDASQCRTKFDDLEASVPFATLITNLDEKYKELSKKYKGGAEGEAEFKLRELVWLKRKNDGF